MAKVSAPLVVPEEDVQRLMELIRGPDKELEKRAKIVLASREPEQNKVIASRLGISSGTVSHWKEAYRENGVDGIGYTKTGRPIQVLPDDFDELVLKASKEAVKWTNETLAEHHGVPLAQVEKSLERQHISLQHASKWYVQTDDSLEANSIELIGIWLGHNHGVLITCTNQYGLTSKPGYLTTRSSTLAKALSKGAVSLENALVEAARHESSSHDPHDKGADIFLQSYFEDAPRFSGLRYQIFGFGEECPKQPPGRLMDTTMSWTADGKEWIDSFCKWAGSNGTSAKHAWVERTAASILFYQARNAEGTCPIFQWTKEVERAGCEGLPITVKNENPFLPSETMEERVAQLLGEEERTTEANGANQLDLHMAVAATTSSGSHSCSVLTCTVLEDMDDFSFDSTDDFLEGLAKAEEPILKLSREAELKAVELSLEELKKKRPLGALRKVTLELLRGKLEVELPETALVGIRPGERLKDRRYLWKICDKVTKKSFRESHDGFIKDFRGEDYDELPYGTFVMDILEEGKLLIEQKSLLVREVLKKHNFSTETGLYMGDELPEELQSKHQDLLELKSDEIMKSLIPDWDPNEPKLDEPEEPKEEELTSGLTPKDKTMTDQEKEQALQQEFAEYFAKYEAEDYPYSRPDTERIQIKKKNRRGKRVEVLEENKAKTLAGFIRWYNQQEAQLKNPSRSIVGRWLIEKSSSQTVCISPDLVYVDKQVKKRRKPGAGIVEETAKQEPQPKKEGKAKDKKDDDEKRIGHMNIRLETENGYYNATSTTRDETYLEMMAVMAENNLFQRRILILMDGEKDIYDRMETLLGHWEWDVYLDWSHLESKMYDKLSIALKARRIPDPRVPPISYKRGKNKGKIKSMSMTSISRLYARAVCSILWVGNTDEAIAYLENINPDDVQNPDELQAIITYLKNKRKWITCYALRRRAGLRNSSNGVEGLNLTIVARRQKHNGMAWLIGSGILAALTCMFKNHQEKEWFFKRTLSFKLIPFPKADKATA